AAGRSRARQRCDEPAHSLFLDRRDRRQDAHRGLRRALCAEGPPPAGGWPLVAWAHGAVGAAAACAPSFRDRSERDVKYLKSWLTAGFAIVAADYQGLGPAGGHPYLATRPEAYGVLTLRLRQPLFVGAGMLDRDVPPAMQTALVLDACLAESRVVWRRYAGLDHSGTVNPSLADSLPFVRDLLAGKPVPEGCEVANGTKP